jgi:tryptophan-rich sensory protein
MQKRKVNIKVLVLCLLIVYAVAFLGSLFTSPATDTSWYESIRPSITPPNWVFPIVWNVLFFLIALSLYFSWTLSVNLQERKRVAFAFGLNLALNVLWSVLYFGMKSPLSAFVEIFFLWASIIYMIYVSSRIDKKAGWLLVPYLLWVSFAIVLNYLSI